MRRTLWPETDEPQHRREMATMCSDADRYGVLVAEDGPGTLVGFAEVSLRDWAEGCVTTPVGFLEGWFVVCGARRRGVGRLLVTAAEAWARSRGCTEMGSDTESGYTVSESAHRRLGFQVVARVVAFRKSLD